jgi:hypothetical protein
MASRDMPNLRTGRIVQLDELATERPVQNLAGSSVRVLGRSVSSGSSADTILARVQLLTKSTISWTVCGYLSSRATLRSVAEVDARMGRLIIEYHGARLAVGCGMLGDMGIFRRSALFQFLGELSVEPSSEVCPP